MANRIRATVQNTVLSRMSNLVTYIEEALNGNPIEYIGRAKAVVLDTLEYLGYTNEQAAEQEELFKLYFVRNTKTPALEPSVQGIQANTWLSGLIDRAKLTMQRMEAEAVEVAKAVALERKRRGKSAPRARSRRKVASSSEESSEESSSSSSSSDEEWSEPKRRTAAASSSGKRRVVDSDSD